MNRREFARVVYYTLKVLESIDGIFAEAKKSLTPIRDTILSQQNKRTGLSDQEISEMSGKLGDVKASSISHLLYVTAMPEPGLVSQANITRWFRENMPSYEGMRSDLVDKLFKNQSASKKEAAKNALKIAEKVQKKFPMYLRSLTQIELTLLTI
jgi:hypothetical protein